MSGKTRIEDVGTSVPQEGIIESERAESLVGEIIEKKGQKFKITEVQLGNYLKPFKSSMTYQPVIVFVNVDDEKDSKYGELGNASTRSSIIAVINSHGYTLVQS